MEKTWELLVQWFDSLQGWTFVLAIAVAICFAIWAISWMFLPFSVWNIASKLSYISDKLDELEGGVQRSVEGINRLNERIDSLAGKLDGVGRESVGRKAEEGHSDPPAA